MYTTTARRVCSLWLRPAFRPSTLFCAVVPSNSRFPHPPLLPTTAHHLLPSSRSFARRSYGPPDDDDDDDDYMEPAEEEDEFRGQPVEEELDEEEERRQARGPSKAERLRLKEKEKRRQKMALRERVDNKKEKRASRERRGGRVVHDFDDDDVIELYDELDADNDGGELADLELTPSTQPAAQTDALIADRQRQKKELLRRRFERPGAEEEDEDEEEEEDEDKEAERPVNEAITAPAIVLIDGSGKRIGLVSTPVALKKARDSQLDIVTLSPPHVTPPVCRVVDYADWLQLERQKKGLDEPTKRSKTLQLRKLIDPHDLQVKAAAMRRFLQRGHQVRVQYFEKTIVDGEWTELFTRVAALVDGVGACQDLVSKPIAVFEPIRKKKEGEEAVKQGKKEKVKKEPQQQPQKEQQLAEGVVPQKDGADVGPIDGEAGLADVKQHAKAGGE